MPAAESRLPLRVALNRVSFEGSATRGGGIPREETKNNNQRAKRKQGPDRKNEIKIAKTKSKRENQGQSRKKNPPAPSPTFVGVHGEDPVLGGSSAMSVPRFLQSNGDNAISACAKHGGQQACLRASHVVTARFSSVVVRRVGSGHKGEQLANYSHLYEG